MSLSWKASFGWWGEWELRVHPCASFPLPPNPPPPPPPIMEPLRRRERGGTWNVRMPAEVLQIRSISFGRLIKRALEIECNARAALVIVTSSFSKITFQSFARSPSNSALIHHWLSTNGHARILNVSIQSSLYCLVFCSAFLTTLSTGCTGQYIFCRTSIFLCLFVSVSRDFVR